MRRPIRVGIIGLGAGTLAAYGRAGDYFRYYEINPAVRRLCETEFSYLRTSAATVDIVIGDGRLLLEAEPAQKFDLLVVDAFSGDSVPAHLLTREAFQLYFKQLKADGLVAVHVTNGYLNLAPVAAMGAAAAGRRALSVETKGDGRQGTFDALYVLASKDTVLEGIPALREAGKPVRCGRRDLWTDDYCNLFRALR